MPSLTVLEQPATAASPAPPAVRLDPHAYARGLACVHCGLCLPTCPTYTETLHEGDSPRGRIQLMLGLHDQQIELTPVVKQHLDLCLDCRACETACPSGVVYHELIEDFRIRTAGGDALRLSAQDRLMRWVFFNLFTRPDRLKWALLPARLMQKIGLYGLLRRLGVFRLLPVRWRKMEQMLPANGSLWPVELPEVLRAQVRYDADAEPGRPREQKAKRRVGFFAGCVGSVMFDQVNRKAVELLAASGCDVIAPREQTCCGAIHHHNGQLAAAQAMARRNIDAMLPAGREADHVELIATNIAGCGAMLREYDLLLRDDPNYADRARDFASRVRDISQVLAEVGLPEMKHPVKRTVTYHDACHLAHAQRVTAEPRRLLASVPGLTIRPLPESDMCCGAAGTYNLTQPEMAMRLAERKLGHIASTGATTCVTGNVGCAMHIQGEARARGQALTVMHPVEIWHAAVFGEGDLPAAGDDHGKV